MPDKSWKAWERVVAKWFHGQRRGADYADRYSQAGKNDIVVDGFSIEVKLLSRPSYSEILLATKQAEAAKENPNDIAVAVVRRKHDSLDDALFVLRRKEFMDNFLGVADDIQSD